jgi:hypothetical protein
MKARTIAKLMMKEGATMNSVAQCVETLERILEEEAEHMARETGFLQRERAISGADFVQSLIFGWLQEPEITLEGQTQVLQRREVSISASGLSQRFTPEAAALLQRVLERLSAEQMQVEPVEIALLKPFSAVILEDSSTITLPPPLAEVWRGCGGSVGASEAAIKLFVRWDVLRGELHGLGLEQGRRNDKRGPLAVEDLPAGCLYVADLGFFGVQRLSRIAHGEPGQPSVKRSFVSRYQSKTVLQTRTGHRIELAGILPQQVNQVREVGALLGQAGRLPVRVIMLRVPTAVADQRRARIRESAQGQGRIPDAEVLWLADWTIVLTNVPRRRLSTEQVLVILRLRWQIERVFRLWKEHGFIDQWRSKKPWRILSEVYAKLAAMVIQQWLIQLGCWQDPHRSLFKAAQVVRREANRLMVALYQGGLEKELREILRCMRSGCRMNTRKTCPNTSQFLLGTPLVWPQRQPASKVKGLT